MEEGGREPGPGEKVRTTRWVLWRDEGALLCYLEQFPRALVPLDLARGLQAHAPPVLGPGLHDAGRLPAVGVAPVAPLCGVMGCICVLAHGDSLSGHVLSFIDH